MRAPNLRIGNKILFNLDYWSWEKMVQGLIFLNHAEL